MRECLLASSTINSENGHTCPKQLIETAIEAMRETHNDTKFSLLGSSTAITTIIDKEDERYKNGSNISELKHNNSAKICNLGDSGFLHIRNGAIIARSKEQTHYFNCPFQLSLPTPGYNSITDTPEKGDLYAVEELRPNGYLLYYFEHSLTEIKIFFYSPVTDSSIMLPITTL